jgi:DNA-binding MarR family transcriptional regulator
VVAVSEGGSPQWSGGPPGGPRGGPRGGPPGGGVAFLLAQLGGYCMERFSERVAVLGLTPPLVGMLRMISTEDGLTQQALAQRLRILPSRMVAFVDDLEERGLVQRQRNPADRRQYALGLTPAGQQLMASIGTVAREHEEDVCSGLTGDERSQLRALLAGVAERHGLSPGVHPGYRRLKPDRKRQSAAKEA